MCSSDLYDSYQRSYKHLSAFVREKKGVEDVTLRSLDRTFYDDFEVFLLYNRAGDLSVTRFAKEEQWNECEVTF